MLERHATTYINDVQSLLNASLLVEAESGINLCGDLAWYYLQDLASKLHKEIVQCSVNLRVDVLASM